MPLANDLFSNVTQLMNRLGLPAGFYDRLLREDDWSFVIKLNALFEGTCTHVLAIRLNTPELVESLAHLDLAHTKVGKIALLRTLNVITIEQFSILRSLAELRNTLVHNITNVNFSFKEYVAELDANQLKSLIKNYGHGLEDSLEVGTKVVSRSEFVKANPKIALWLTAAEVLACLHLEFEMSHLRIKQLAVAEYQALVQQEAISMDQTYGLLTQLENE